MPSLPAVTVRRTGIILLMYLAGFSVTVRTGAASQQGSPIDSTGVQTPAMDDVSPSPSRIDVTPVADDEQFRARLQRVLEATEWFSVPVVRVEEGVVFLSGEAPSEELRKWAGDLARNTQDVVAVANGIEVIERSPWDFSRASSGMRTLWHDLLRNLPILVFGILVLILSFFLSGMAVRVAAGFLGSRIQPRLLRTVISRAVGIFVFLVGVYLLLRILGLTQLALTVVGGTGLIGLVVGIAFRDITENFLASIFLSMQRPFQTGDLIEVAGVTGYVQQLNMRTTIVMTLDGILVQVPNASVYKSNIRNYTTNSNRREEFKIGIGYDAIIGDAQEIARSVLIAHPAVLDDPEPAVLVSGLGPSTVNLCVYFWLDGSKHSWLKVRSSVIRLVKREFQKKGISMPDESREMVFPRGVHVTLEKATVPQAAQGAPEADTQVSSGTDAPGAPDAADEAASSRAEAGLYSEAGVIKEQARRAQPATPEENLLQEEPAVTEKPSP